MEVGTKRMSNNIITFTVQNTFLKIIKSVTTVRKSKHTVKGRFRIYAMCGQMFVLFGVLK